MSYVDGVDDGVGCVCVSESPPHTHFDIFLFHGLLDVNLWSIRSTNETSLHLFKCTVSVGQFQLAGPIIDELSHIINQ
jgi:hypothetical protein